MPVHSCSRHYLMAMAREGRLFLSRVPTKRSSRTRYEVNSTVPRPFGDRQLGYCVRDLFAMELATVSTRPVPFGLTSITYYSIELSRMGEKLADDWDIQCRAKGCSD